MNQDIQACGRQINPPDAPGRLENLKELITAMEPFDALGGFLEHISLVMDNEASSDEGEESL